MNRPPMKDETSDSQRMPLMAVALARSVDFKIPLWAIIVLAGSGLFAVSRMYVQVEQLVAATFVTNENLSKVVQQLNDSSREQAVMRGQIMVIQDRMSRIEQDHSRLIGRLKGEN